MPIVDSSRGSIQIAKRDKPDGSILPGRGADQRRCYGFAERTEEGEMGVSGEAPRTGTVDDGGPVGAGVPARVRQALATERIEVLTRMVAELKATRSELQYDLSVALDTLAEERKRLAIVEAQHRTALGAEQHKAALAEERLRVANRERDIATVRDLAALRLEVAHAERDNEALRERVRQLSGMPSLLERRRTQVADLRERLSLIVHDRKALRRELKRRAGLLARLRSDVRAAEESVFTLQRSVRGLERENWVLRGETGANRALRKQNAELVRLVDELGEGFHAVLASRRWRLGAALLALPRLLLFRRNARTAPEALLQLVVEHRRRQTNAIEPLPNADQGAAHSAPGGQVDRPRG